MASLENRLDSAIADLLAGATSADIDPELAGLLTPASILLSTPVPAPSQRLARGRMLAAVRAQQQRPGLLAWLGLGALRMPKLQALRLAPMVAIVALFILIALSGNALPGQPIYPLKRGVEAIRLLGVQDPAERSLFYADLADRRLTELEMLVKRQRPISVGAIESIGQAWAMAVSAPGADINQLRLIAAEHARRLQNLIPLLPPHLQAPAQDVLDDIMRIASGDNPFPTPTPDAIPDSGLDSSPSPPPSDVLPRPPSAGTPSPDPTDAPDVPRLTPATPTPTPAAGVPPMPGVTPTPTASPTDDANTPTPAPGETVSPTPTGVTTPSVTTTPGLTTTPSPTIAPTRTITPSGTPTPTATHEPDETETPEPDETETPESTRTPTPTWTPRPTSTPSPKPTQTPAPTRTPTPTWTPRPTNTPHPTSTPSPDPTETPEPTKTPEPTETPEPTRTPEPTETPDETETPEPDETETPEPTETPDGDSFVSY